MNKEGISLKSCIYCGSNKELTKSDIIPDSITTAKCINSNVCKKCNNSTNTQFESAFANNFAFFRNQLDYRLRRKNAIVPFLADIYINVAPSFDVEPAFRYRFTTYKEFINNKLIFDKSGNIIGIRDVKPELSVVFNPEIHYSCKIENDKLLWSDATLKTIAKICFEWHCKQNYINEKLDRYNDIRNYINGSDDSRVKIVEDDYFLEVTLSTFRYISGSHAFLEYKENNSRVVLFTLFGVIWYKVFICDDFATTTELEEMHQYSLDKQVRVSKSNATAFKFSLSNTVCNEIEKHFFLPPATIEVPDITEEKAIKWIEKLRELTSGVYLTYHEVLRMIDTLEKENYFDQPLEYYNEFLIYQMNRRILSVTLIYTFGEKGYDDNKTFIHNLKEKNFDVHNHESVMNFRKSYVVEPNFMNFKSTLKMGIETLKSLPPQE